VEVDPNCWSAHTETAAANLTDWTVQDGRQCHHGR